MKEFTGKHMLLVLALFFGTIIAVNILLAVQASRSWTGLIVRNSYVESQKFDDYLAEAAEQAARGWQADVAHRAGAMVVRLSDRGGADLTGFTVKLRLKRPVVEGHDRQLELVETEPGLYIAPVAVRGGVWQAEVLALRGQDRLRHGQRLWIRDD